MTAGIDLSRAAEACHPGRGAGADAFALETQGWSSRPEECGPKIAALSSLVNLAPPTPVGKVAYESRGNLLIVAGDDAPRARGAALDLASKLPVTLLERDPASEAAPYTSWQGMVGSLTGYLGSFTAAIANLRVAGGSPAATSTDARFDLVLDFSREALFAMRQPPQGYFRAPAGDDELARVLVEVAEAVGEFEKPRYFALRENLCAHSRSGIVGCSACIDICSTQAIAPDGDRVKVDPHLCMGCGACATVCPSGAMSFVYPRVSDRGAQLKQLLTTYRAAGGADPCVVFHNGYDGRELLAAAAASGRGLPARALPLEAWHVASIGLDLLLPAVAFGAANVVVLSAGSEDAEYVAALRAQMAIGESVLSQLGYSGTHFSLVQASGVGALASAIEVVAPAAAPGVAATFLLSDDKRTAIEFAVEHLLKHAPRRMDELALPAGAPFGEVRVDKSKCTMCLACAGACPESALMDGADRPMLRFLERNCVQCGLCESTCPEDAITLSPRLLLTPQVREARVLNETEPFHCTRCGKAFGTRQMVDAMLGRLAGHSMFAGGGALERLQMCADCRVVAMMQSRSEASVLSLGGDA